MLQKNNNLFEANFNYIKKQTKIKAKKYNFSTQFRLTDLEIEQEIYLMLLKELDKYDKNKSNIKTFIDWHLSNSHKRINRAFAKKIFCNSDEDITEFEIELGSNVVDEVIVKDFSDAVFNKLSEFNIDYANIFKDAIELGCHVQTIATKNDCQPKKVYRALEKANQVAVVLR